MIEEVGIIKKIFDDNMAIVIADRTSMCGNCPSKGMCHPFGGDENKIEITAYNRINAKQGDIVKVQIDEKIFLKASFIVYGIPILFLLIFSVLGKVFFKKDIFSFITGFLGMIMSFILIKFYENRNKRNIRPEITEILSESSCNQ